MVEHELQGERTRPAAVLFSPGGLHMRDLPHLNLALRRRRLAWGHTIAPAMMVARSGGALRLSWGSTQPSRMDLCRPNDMRLSCRPLVRRPRQRFSAFASDA